MRPNPPRECLYYKKKQKAFKACQVNRALGDRMGDFMSDALNQTKEAEQEFGSTQIKIVTAGIGGGGCNIVNRLIKAGVKGTEFVAINTDAQHFRIIDDRIKQILIGKSLTKGLG